MPAPASARPDQDDSARQPAPDLWGALLGQDHRRRSEAARAVRAVGDADWYARRLLDALPELRKWQRANAGEALSLLGDPRFSPPYYLSEMLYIPDGTVLLGSAHYPDERPVHAVEVAGFSLAIYPVIQAAYAVFVEETGHRSPRGWRRGRPDPACLNMPVVFVSAQDAEAYCAWLSARTGDAYHLPTEAEWELAARGEDNRRIYPWGDIFDDEHVNAWEENPLEGRCAVGLFPEARGPYGHHDLAGNVWEWCSSLFWPYPYRADDGREDPGALSSPRVMRGGSWRSRANSLRCAVRQGEAPQDSFSVTGFRIARDTHRA